LRKKVLITGLEGFTGIYLENVLREKGYEVYGTSLMDSKKPYVFTCNITKSLEIETIVHDIQPDYVIHLAGIAFVAETNASLIYDVNVMGTENLLKALCKLQKKPRKVILASSATVYGHQESAMLDETMCPKPVSHYGFSKLAMEHLGAVYFEKLPILITRPFNYTGVGQDEHFLIPKIVKHYKENQRSIELGNLNVSREFNDVRDVVLWYVGLLEGNACGEIVNLCSGTAISLMDIVSLMNGVAGYEMHINVNQAYIREHEIPTLFGSTSKLHQLICVQKACSIQETLETMYFSKGL